MCKLQLLLLVCAVYAAFHAKCASVPRPSAESVCNCTSSPSVHKAGTGQAYITLCKVHP